MGHTRRLLSLTSVFILGFLLIGCQLGTYKLIFETDGGTTIEPFRFRANQSVTPPEDPTKPGMIFMGWFTDVTFQHTFSFEGLTRGTKTAYAKWGSADDINHFFFRLIASNSTSITVQIVVDGSVHFNGYDIQLTFDAAQLSVESVTQGLANVTNSLTAGVVRFNYSDVTTPIVNPTELMTITFARTSTSTTTLHLEIRELYRVNESFELVLTESTTSDLTVD